MNNYYNRTVEDRLLEAYHSGVGGRLYKEVVIAWSRGAKDWPPAQTHFSIDAIRLSEPHHESQILHFADYKQEVLDLVEGSSTELIEVKEKLNREVIGQVIAGRMLFRGDYRPSSIRSVIVCKETDTALEWVCEQLDIKVAIEAPDNSSKRE